MAISLILRKQVYTLEGTHTVSQALEALGLSAEAHLVVRNGDLLNEREALKDGDIVKIVPVISGGVN